MRISRGTLRVTPPRVPFRTCPLNVALELKVHPTETLSGRPRELVDGADHVYIEGQLLVKSPRWGPSPCLQSKSSLTEETVGEQREVSEDRQKKKKRTNFKDEK